MTKDPRLDKKSVLYIPDYVGDLGYTQEEADQLSEKDLPEIERRTEAFRRKHLEQLELKSIDKKENVRMELMSHWYRRLTEKEIIDLVERTRHLYPILNELSEKSTIKSMAVHQIKLLNSIKNGAKPSIRPAKDSQLKRFPRYDYNTKKLYGSKYSFLALWSHVFSLKSNNGNKRKNVLESM